MKSLKHMKQLNYLESKVLMEYIKIWNNFIMAIIFFIGSIFAIGIINQAVLIVFFPVFFLAFLILLIRTIKLQNDLYKDVY